MTKLQNELSLEQLDAISGGSYSRDCGDGRGRRDDDCDDDRRGRRDDDCGGGRGNRNRRHRRDNDDCRPNYRSNRCD